MPRFLRLTSYITQQEFVITTRLLEGYWLHPNEDSVTLFAMIQPIQISNSPYCKWDNWDEFVAQLKSYFSDKDKEEES